MVTELPSITDARGKLVFMEAGEHIPFAIQRVFILHDLVPGQERGNHAHRRCHQFVIAMSGAMTIELDDGKRRWTHSLAARSEGVYVPPMTWIVVRDFDAHTVCVVLASERYNPHDYIHDYEEFVSAVREAGW